MPDPAVFTRTPTETLMSALSECETADNCLIILRHKGGYILARNPEFARGCARSVGVRIDLHQR